MLLNTRTQITTFYHVHRSMLSPTNKHSIQLRYLLEIRKWYSYSVSPGHEQFWIGLLSTRLSSDEGINKRIKEIQ